MSQPALINARTGRIVASATELALTRTKRRRGLLDRSEFDPSAALVLAPCLMIHTAFMRFAIDVIFVDRTGRVMRVVRDLGPWRIAGSFGAYATIELTSGALGARDVAVGDRLYLEGAANAGFGVGRPLALSADDDGSLRSTTSSPAAADRRCPIRRF